MKTTKRILLADGYEMVVADDGKQGLEKIELSEPACVVPFHR